MNTVVIYSNDTCVNCENLKKALAIKGIEYQEINITSQPTEGEKIRGMGFRTLPVINNKGEWLHGFTAMNFKKIVQSNLAAA